MLSVKVRCGAPSQSSKSFLIFFLRFSRTLAKRCAIFLSDLHFPRYLWLKVHPTVLRIQEQKEIASNDPACQLKNIRRRTRAIPSRVSRCASRFSLTALRPALRPLLALRQATLVPRPSCPPAPFNVAAACSPSNYRAS